MLFFFGGYKYWYNTKYKSKDGVITEYYVFDNKWVIYFNFMDHIFIMFFILHIGIATNIVHHERYYISCYELIPSIYW